jgi:predicted chitinase
MATELSASVGQDAPNRRTDVRIVQRMLNESIGMLTPFRRLAEDGLMGKMTLNLIVEFQQRVVSMLHPDGRVDPGGRTYRRLLEASGRASSPWDANGATRPAALSQSSSADGKLPAGAVTLDQLKQVMPHLGKSKAEAYVGPLNVAMAEGNINTALRQAAFLAQIAHESVELRYFEEIASGAAYEGRASLGNTQPGDGKRYKGRGPIQLTGRTNYRHAGKALGIDLEGQPELAALPEHAFRVSVWFWTSRDLNSKADAEQFDAITKKVNGGFRGKASRDAYYARAKRVLGI